MGATDKSNGECPLELMEVSWSRFVYYDASLVEMITGKVLSGVRIGSSVLFNHGVEPPTSI